MFAAAVPVITAAPPAAAAWYVENGMKGVPAERLEIFDCDVELGVGVSLLWTPGHTVGNHSLCVNTPDGPVHRGQRSAVHRR